MTANEQSIKHSTVQTRPLVAWISNSLPPYRLFHFRRIIHEIPEIELHCLFTHAPGKTTANLPWQQEYPPDIHAVPFHHGQSIPTGVPWSDACRDWQKGGQIIQWLKEHDAAAGVIGGYNDMARVRIMRWCARNQVPWFLVADSNILGDVRTGWRAKIKKLLLGKLLASCSGVLVCGSLGAQYFRRYGLPDDKIFVAPYESEFELYQQLDDRQLKQTRETFSLQPGRRRLIFSGRLVPVKRVDLLINAFAVLALQRTDWDLVVVGDGPLRKLLQAQVPDQLRNRVQWLGFIENQKTLAAIYQQCDVLVLPSDDEPWGIVVTEAAAAGLAIVASNIVGAAHELLQDGVNGRLFPKGSRSLLLEALLEVTDKQKIDQFRNASRATFRQWRACFDPVHAFRKALTSTRLISAEPTLSV